MEKKTIAQQLGHNFETGSLKLYNKAGKQVYFEDSDCWWKAEYDQNGNEIYFEDSTTQWAKWQFDQNGKEIYFEDSDGYWTKRGYDENGEENYFENSDGTIRDNRPATCIDKVVEIDGKRYKLVEA